MEFLPNEFYHVYNRGNNKQLVFIEEENYIFFANKIQKELKGFAELVAYCLMPNHYHLLIYTNGKIDNKNNSSLNRKLGTLQSSYTRAFNLRFNRTGSLFQSKMKSKILNKNEHQLRTCFHYIHQNPLKAKLVNRMEEWQFSSYNAYLNHSSKTILNRQIAFERIAIPESREMFIKESLSVIDFDDED
jgi:REP element-mobilizing transposase RayT